jgi:tetratricopeptide (TPR) repeat protein
MATNKSRINIVFACIVAILGLTAAREIYLNHFASANQPAATRESAGVQLPENHPSPEAVERLMDLGQKIAEDPQNADYRTQMANIYFDLGQFDKAADFYQQSLEISPGVPSVETDLATCYHYLGQVDKALETLDKVLQYRPGFPQAMFNKGIILAYEKNDVQGAIRIWEDLSRSDPAFSQKAELEQKIRQLKAANQ